MASAPGVLYEWPWERLGGYKWLLMAPFAATAARAHLFGGAPDADSWCTHMVLVTALRVLHGHLWMSASRFHPLIQKHQIQTKGIKFEQVDREEKWCWLLMAPFAATAARAHLFGGAPDADSWCTHMVLVTALRVLHGHLWMSASRFHPLIQKHQIQTKGIKFEQVDREEKWCVRARSDDYLILHVLVATAVHTWLPGFQGLPLFHGWGLLMVLLLHVGPTEWVYYWAHRALHHHYLYNRYHSHHHASFVTEPVTGNVHPFAEHVLYTAIFAIPMLGTWLLGGASMAMFYAYWLGFDFLNAVGHCNWEFVPARLLRALPFLKYLVYTPTFHSLHHSQVHTNFCLFMPLYDYLGGTVDPASDSLHAAVRKGAAHLRHLQFPRATCRGLLPVTQCHHLLTPVACTAPAAPCHMTMERGCAHACHAGGLVHALEGWEHHEVGAIDPSRIDLTWQAALKHGFKPV
eukprot:jgi/Mesen1/8111/ME000435S07281